jgi:hypothetical protein
MCVKNIKVISPPKKFGSLFSELDKIGCISCGFLMQSYKIGQLITQKYHKRVKTINCAAVNNILIKMAIDNGLSTGGIFLAKLSMVYYCKTGS